MTSEHSEHIERARSLALDEIEEGEPTQYIVMQVANRTMGRGFLDDYWDDYDDTIQVSEGLRFRSGGDPIVTVEFKQGLSLAVAARMLRKCLTLLEGEFGEDVVNLGPGDGEDDFSHTRLLPDGSVGFCNLQRSCREWDEKRAAEGGEAKITPTTGT